MPDSARQATSTAPSATRGSRSRRTTLTASSGTTGDRGPNGDFTTRDARPQTTRLSNDNCRAGSLDPALSATCKAAVITIGREQERSMGARSSHSQEFHAAHRDGRGWSDGVPARRPGSGTGGHRRGERVPPRHPLRHPRPSCPDVGAARAVVRGYAPALDGRAGHRPGRGAAADLTGGVRLSRHHRIRAQRDETPSRPARAVLRYRPANGFELPGDARPAHEVQGRRCARPRGAQMRSPGRRSRQHGAVSRLR